MDANNLFYQNSMINTRKDNDEWRNAAGTCSPNLIEKSINENGDYSAKADGADGYSSVTVNVDTNFNNLIYSNCIGVRDGVPTVSVSLIVKADDGIYSSTVIPSPTEAGPLYSSAYITCVTPVKTLDVQYYDSPTVVFTPDESIDLTSWPFTEAGGDTVVPGDGKAYVMKFSRNQQYERVITIYKQTKDFTFIMS